MCSRKFHLLLIPILCIPAIFLFSVQPRFAQAGSWQAQPDLQAIDAFIASQMRAHRIPGLALAVTSGDQILYLRGYGSAGNGHDMTAQTPLYIASVTKSFTALATMQLVDQGLLDLDSPVQDYLPWFKVADEEAAKRITVRHLLNQTSGMSNTGYRERVGPSATLEDAVHDLSNLQITARPGTAFHYFEGNYRTLGLIIEAVSGLSYGEYLQQHIFDPLEMRRSFVSRQLAEEAGLAQGHAIILGVSLPRSTTFLPYALPGGFLITTAEDMAHYMIAQLNEGRYKSTRVLSSEGVSEMHRPAAQTGSQHYAMGWFATERFDTRVIQHSGEMRPTFYANAMLIPSEGYGIGILINQYGGLHTLMAYPGIIDGVAGLLLGKDPPNGIPMSLLFGILTVVIILHVVQFARKLRSLPRWGREIQDRPEGKIAREIALHFILSLSLYIGFPFVYVALIGSQFSWSGFFFNVPEVSSWLLFAILNDLLLGTAKTWLFLRNRREKGVRVRLAV